MATGKYILTPRVRKRLGTLGFNLVCYRCGHPLQIGDRVESHSVRNLVKRLYHEACFESLYSEGREAPAQREPRPLRLIPGYHRQLPAPHIKLMKGVAILNPHPQVLCPMLARGSSCHKHKNYIFLRPELLVKNHADPNLQLWSCEGCKHFLLKIEKEGRFKPKFNTNLVL